MNCLNKYNRNSDTYYYSYTVISFVQTCFIVSISEQLNASLELSNINDIAYSNMLSNIQQNNCISQIMRPKTFWHKVLLFYQQHWVLEHSSKLLVGLELLEKLRFL